MNRYANALILTACFLFTHSSLIFAAQFFERNGLAIDGHDPVAYFREQKPVKVVLRGRDDAWVEVDGKKSSPSEISAMILGKLKQAAEDYLGEKVEAP